MTGLEDKLLHLALVVTGGAIWHFLKALMDHLAEKEVAFFSRLLRKKPIPIDENFI